MKFRRLYLIKLSDDPIIDKSATTYRKFYQVPKERKFVSRAADAYTDHRASTKANTKWSLLSSLSLFNVGINDKLMIVAHGSITKCGGFLPEELAKKLRECSLTSVGLITFKCCHLGSGDFLEDFRDHAAKAGIKVGWVKGYRGVAHTHGGDHGGDGGHKLHLPGQLLSKPNETIDGPYGVGSNRYKIVECKASYNVPGSSRYIVAQDDDDDT